MAVTREMLLSELKDLLRLTAFEQTVATVRRAQARTTPIERELAENAKKAGERLSLLRSAVAPVGGVPDVVNPVLGKAGAFVQTQVNQVQTLQGALLGDLALEHQLRERTRYARTLAESLGYSQVIPVLDRLETAHTATIEWLETRLSEVGRTGTSALEATPVQAAVGNVRKIAGAPFGLLAAGVNRGSSLLRRGASSAVDTVGSTAGKAVDSVVAQVEATAEDVTGYTDGGGADAKTAKTAKGAVKGALKGAAKAVQDTAEDAKDAAEGAVEGTAEAVEQALDVQALDEDHAPFAGYASLSGDSVMRHVRDSEDVEHLREILAFEQAHKARKGVLKELEDRLSELAGASA